MKAIFSAMFVSAALLASPNGAFAAGGYIQASSEEDQIAKDTKPVMITMASTDAAKGIKNNNGVVLLDQTGTYFTVVGVQVGSRGGTGLVRLWFQTNGKDVDNSNCEQMVPTADYTTVIGSVAELPEVYPASAESRASLPTVIKSSKSKSATAFPT